MANVAGFVSEILNPCDDRTENGFGAGVDQNKFAWGGLEQSNRNNIGRSKVQCINETDHSLIDKPPELSGASDKVKKSSKDPRPGAKDVLISRTGHEQMHHPISSDQLI